ncbi:hypothetical protein FVEG_10519 [Fusarium verticillioides 7600]|uniref:Uncharacterized protein n=1 Tax=Gibberella moniliformis (strain M3125 / FGSC 7600) TaxID=334819 RepID=W7MUZ9_GIBM7|nr:hypothetical protein FVEG_10519 [Fusarium verticillioides 7600]EWG51594.1 hypothetical protein FVEG_10519 [Fusarium verticillioides 7600]
MSYQSNPTSSSSIRSVTERSQGSESESEQKRLSRQSTKKHQLQEQSQVTQVLRKQLKAERQLILALEEAVTDLEAHVKELLSECQHWKQKSAQLQTKVDDYKENAFTALQPHFCPVAILATFLKRRLPVPTIGCFVTPLYIGIALPLIPSATLSDVQQRYQLKTLVGEPDTANADITGPKIRREVAGASFLIGRVVNDEIIVRI